MWNGIGQKETREETGKIVIGPSLINNRYVLPNARG
jgi:hypothetical protein